MQADHYPHGEELSPSLGTATSYEPKTMKGLQVLWSSPGGGTDEPGSEWWTRSWQWNMRSSHAALHPVYVSVYHKK